MGSTVTLSLRYSRQYLYQGRFNDSLILQDGHFLRVCRYMDRNAEQDQTSYVPFHEVGVGAAPPNKAE